MAFDKNLVTSMHQVHGGLMEASGLWTMKYTGVIADLTDDSTDFKDYLDGLNIAQYDWIMAQLSDSSNLGTVIITTTNAKLSLLAFV